MWDWPSKLVELRAADRAVAVVTVGAVSGSTPCSVGAKMLVLADETCFGTIGGGNLERLAAADAKGCLASGQAASFRYPLGARAGQCCGGVVEVLVEVIGTGPLLYLFGAGHVGQALVRVLAGTAFTVHVIDERPEWLEKLPPGVARHEEPWEAFVERTTWDDERTYVAIMTHRHDLDEDVLFAVADKPARYVGLIGSKTKWARISERLAGRGRAAEAIARVRCPIGLDIGGKEPVEVAISVAAELVKTHHGK